VLTHQNGRPTPPKRVVIIGGHGFIGSTIHAELAAADVPVLPLGRPQLDLLSTNGSDVLKPHLSPDDAVVFVSAVAPAKTLAHLMTNLRMAEAACAAFAAVKPAHLLYISSDAVYTDNANPVSERSAIAPSTMHGMMHAARELIFRTEYDGPFAALRPTLVYGARDPHSGYGPNRFRRQAAKGDPITIFGEGEEKRDHVAVEDVARLARLILFHRSTGALNATTGVSISFNDIAHMVAAQFSPQAEVKSVPRSGPRPHLLHRFFDITSCRKAFPKFQFRRLPEDFARVHREAIEAAG
jgi:nucleoside-diphosphate-sugar epimerase